MPQKIDLGTMAQAAHDKQIQTRKDGGPGSGPQQGGGKMVNISLPKNKKRLTIQQAEHALSQKGYKLGDSSFKGGVTSWTITKGGKSETITAKQLRKKVYS